MRPLTRGTVDLNSRRSRPQLKAKRFLNSLIFESFIVILIVADILCITAELFLGAHLVSGLHAHLRKLFSPQNKTQISTTETPVTSSYSSSHIQGVTVSTVLSNETLTSTTEWILNNLTFNKTCWQQFPVLTDPVLCSQDLDQYVESHPEYRKLLSFLVLLLRLQTIARFISLGIASFFILEISIRLIFTFRYFIKSKWNIFDMVVVVTNFTVEILFISDVLGCRFCEALSYVVVLRLWKLPKICNIRSHVFRRKAKFYIHRYEAARRKAEETSRILHYKLENKEKQIRQLEVVLNIQKQVDAPSKDSSSSFSFLSNSVTEELNSLGAGNFSSFADAASLQILSEALPQAVKQQKVTPKPHKPHLYTISSEFSKMKRYGTHLDVPMDSHWRDLLASKEQLHLMDSSRTLDSSLGQSELTNISDISIHVNALTTPYSTHNGTDKISNFIAYDNESFSSDEKKILNKVSSNYKQGETYTNEKGMLMTEL